MDVLDGGSIFLASREGNLERVKYLVEMGQDVNEADWIGNQSIHIAARNGQLEVLQFLVEERGANISANGFNFNAPIHFACEKGETEVLKYLLHQKADPHSHCNRDANQPIHLIALNGNIESLKLLVETCGADVNATNANFDRPLHLACANGKNMNAIEYLVQHGADINARNNNGRSVLYAAIDAVEDNVDIVKWLISQKANVDIDPAAGLMHAAASRGNVAIMKLLMSFDIPIDGLADGNYPLHSAAACVQMKTVKFLVEECGIDPNILNKKGEKPVDLIEYLSREDECEHNDLIRYFESAAERNDILIKSAR